MSGDFVHLHLHTQYSLLDGANRVKDLIRKVKASGMDAVAVTDHGNMFGAYDLQTTALEAGIKPILGVEAYIAPGSRFDRETVKTFDGEGNNYHLTLLVETPEGYKNLVAARVGGVPRRASTTSPGWTGSSSRSTTTGSSRSRAA